MWATVFTTVFSGVIVYVLGQILVKCVLDPYVSFKEHLGRISSLFLREQSKIMNVKLSSDLVNELKSSSGLLIAKSKAIPCYDFFARMRMVPNYKNVIDASQHMNLIASTLEEVGAYEPYSNRPIPTGSGTITSSLNAIGDNLNIIVNYSTYK